MVARRSLEAGTDALHLLPELQKYIANITLVYFGYHVLIDILNPRGDARVTFKFDVSNFGLTPHFHLDSPFWFEHAQENVPFESYDDSGVTQPIEILKSAPNFREIRLHFNPPLKPAERRKFSLSFVVREDFLKTQLYYLRPRVLVTHLSFTVSASHSGFKNSYVMHESADGYLKDTAPQVVLSQNGERRQARWEVKSPQPGDLYRTFWSYDRAQQGAANVISISR